MKQNRFSHINEVTLLKTELLECCNYHFCGLSLTPSSEHQQTINEHFGQLVVAAFVISGEVSYLIILLSIYVNKNTASNFCTCLRHSLRYSLPLFSDAIALMSRDRQACWTNTDDGLVALPGWPPSVSNSSSRAQMEASDGKKSATIWSLKVMRFESAGGSAFKPRRSVCRYRSSTVNRSPLEDLVSI